MRYAIVRAIAAGTAALSTGLVRFEPDSEDPRHHGCVCLPDDAKTLVDKKIGEVIGEGGPAEMAEFVALSAQGPSDPGRRMSAMIKRLGLDKVDETEGEDAAPPKVAKSVATLANRPQTESQGFEAMGTQQGIRELRSTLQQITSVTTLEAMLENEKSGANRGTAVSAIEARIRAVTPAETEVEAEAEGGGDEGGPDGGGEGAGDGTGAGDEGGASAEPANTEGGGVTPAEGNEGAAAPATTPEPAPAATTEEAATGEAASSGEASSETNEVDPDAAPVE